MDKKLVTYRAFCLLMMNLVCLSCSFSEGGENSNENFVNDVHLSHVSKTNETLANAEMYSFTNYLFAKYGKNGTLSFEGFEHLLENLKIGNIKLLHNWEWHIKNKSILLGIHINHNHSFNLNIPFEKKLVDNDHNYKQDGNVETSLKSEVTHKHVERDAEINTEPDYREKCFRPTELLQIYGYGEKEDITKEQFFRLCPAIVSQIDTKACLLDEDHIHQKEKIGKVRNILDIPIKVWGYGTCAILVISLTGLVVVSLIPLIQKMLITSLLQFLVALAVGALSGDALLHLIPHSLQPHGSEHQHDDSGHSLDGVFKGLCGLGAIYFFLLFGRIQAIIGSKKSKEKSEKHYSKDAVREKYETQTDVFIYKDEEAEKNSKNELDELHECHGHSHSQEVPSSIPALAWRIIIGDGIHNLCDGLAIGVAFSNSVTGGISTSIAVLCHELPHEMGDFAVLLQKGMTVKQAIICNCISSILSLIGMYSGVMLGNMGEASLWIFVAVAGMFLYISLVDLVPEMSALHIVTNGKRQHEIKNLMIQASGMFTGSGIMFLIAIYEEQLKTALDS